MLASSLSQEPPCTYKTQMKTAKNKLIFVTINYPYFHIQQVQILQDHKVLFLLFFFKTLINKSTLTKTSWLIYFQLRMFYQWLVWKRRLLTKQYNYQSFIIQLILTLFLFVIQKTFLFWIMFNITQHPRNQPL